jgi:hypothetical protein
MIRGFYFIIIRFLNAGTLIWYLILVPVLGILSN